jgi:hypothetical protein
MINEKQIKQWIKERSNLHPNDPKISYYWNKIEKELTKDEKETIEFLKTCSSEELYYLSESFEEMSIAFQSKEFISVLKELSKKYPKADLDIDIEIAQRVVDNEE